MKVMISVLSATEARQAILCGTGILDVKNPAEGSLGAQSPRVIREIRALSREGIEISVAIGDVPDLPGTAALAALGAACCGADYIKVGLHGPRTEAAAMALLREVRAAVTESKTSVIVAGYADYRRAGTLDPRCLPRLAASSGIKGCLIDTAVKDGQTLFDFLEPQELRSLAAEAHDAGLLFGAAGSLRKQDLPILKEVGVDVAGLRTAACRDGRRGGQLEPGLVRDLLAFG
jgi:hypothetical protein